MRWSVFLISVCLGCSSSTPKRETSLAEADGAWRARVRASGCRHPSVATSGWPEFVTARRQATIRIPLFLKPDRYQAARESTNARKTGKYPPLASGWNNVDSRTDFAQLGVGVLDSVKLVYPGPAEPEENICIERVDGAQATIFSSNRGARLGVQENAVSSDTAALPPYVAFATMRFPDGLSLRIFGTASTPDQQSQMLAAIRTIRRFHDR
jgi:hypothetical protein